MHNSNQESERTQLKMSVGVITRRDESQTPTLARTTNPSSTPTFLKRQIFVMNLNMTKTVARTVNKNPSTTKAWHSLGTKMSTTYIVIAFRKIRIINCLTCQLTDTSGLYYVVYLRSEFAYLLTFSLQLSDITSEIQRLTLYLNTSCRECMVSGGYKSICVAIS